MKELSQREELTTKQEAFCVHYTTIGSGTFGNATKSALAACYSEKGAYVRGSELLRIRKIIDRISELHAENMIRNGITVDKVLTDLEHDKIMARKHDQYAVAKGCTELQGKFLSMFVDRLQTESTEAQRQLNAHEAMLADKIAEKLLDEDIGANTRALEDVQGQDQIA